MSAGSWAHRAATVVCLCAIAASSPASASADVKVYRARHRSAEELLPLVETALAGQGRVAVDTTTAALVLSGEPAALRRALRLLAEVDRRLRHLELAYAVEDESALAAFGLSVEWSVGAGGLRAGTLPISGTALRVRLQQGGARRTGTFRGRLRLVEGEPGLLVTGSERPIPAGRGVVASAVAETGFEVLPTVLGSGTVRLELRAFAGEHAPGGAVRYTGAATVVEVAPGACVAVAGVDELRENSSTALDGTRRTGVSSSRVLLIAVEVDSP